MHQQVRPAGVAYGECWCGCGEKTNLAPSTNRTRGWVAGEPVRYLHGHYAREAGGGGKGWPTRYVVAANGCWRWAGTKFSNGYGFFFKDGKRTLAHRAMYELHVGPIPRGMQIDHVRERGCMYRDCVNPAHLEPVTGFENVHRGRATRLTPEIVEQIRHAPGLQREIAKRFGIPTPYVSMIRSGKRRANG